MGSEAKFQHWLSAAALESGQLVPAGWGGVEAREKFVKAVPVPCEPPPPPPPGFAVTGATAAARSTVAAPAAIRARRNDRFIRGCPNTDDVLPKRDAAQSPARRRRHSAAGVTRRFRDRAGASQSHGAVTR